MDGTVSDSDSGLRVALRAAREQAGMTPEQVSARTHVRLGILRDLEDGRVASSGGAVYARGHLKAIAGVTGSDADTLLRAFERMQPATPVGLNGPAPRLPRGRPARRTPRWGAAGLLAVAALSVAVTIGALRPAEAHRPVPAAQRSTPSRAAPAVVPPVGPAPSPSAGASLQVRVLGGASWMRISGKDSVLVQGVLASGFAKDFTDPVKLDVVVGRKTYVTLVCGGKPVALPGQGDVLRVTCSDHGFAAA